jgi:hypothetical protein
VSAAVRLTVDRMAALRAHLDEPESVAFCLADLDDGVFTVVGLDLLGAEEIASRSAEHVELTDEARARLIQTAWADRLSLIEMHSHGEWSPAEFSASDLHGFEHWVPHVWWRLRGIPYAALVVGGQTWDGLAWTADPRAPEPVEAIELVGGAETSKTIVPTGLTYRRLARTARGEVRR